MTWATAKVDRRQEWPAGLGTISVAVGVESTRGCGCRIRIGVRLDALEPVFAYAHCPAHQREAEAAHRALREMPPSPEPLLELAQTLLDKTILERDLLTDTR